MSSRVMTETVTVTTTGSAGSATGSATSDAMNGFLLDVFFDWHASAPATSDVTVAYGTPGGGNLVVASNSSTDVRHAPRKNAVDLAGAATGVYVEYPLNGTLTVSVAGCDALTGAVVAHITYLRPF